MKSNSIKLELLSGNYQQKINILSYLSDLFESYNKDIKDFDEIVNFLIDYFISEEELNIKCEILETLVKAAVYQDMHNKSFDKIEESLDKIPSDCLSRAIDILSFSHNKKYISVIEKYRSHKNSYVREAVDMAIKEINGGSQ